MAQALQERMGNVANNRCDETIMKKPGDLMTRLSFFAADSRIMDVVEQEEILRSDKAKQTPHSVRFIFDINYRMHDQHRYNLPRANEVAVVFVGDNEEVPKYRHIAVHPSSQNLQTISMLNADSDPMMYSIVFSRGDDGWHPEIEKTDQSRNRKRVSMLQFHSYRLAVPPSFSPIHYAGKLLQQYMADAYVKTKQNRLVLHRQNQRVRRLDMYKGLMDHPTNESAAFNRKQIDLSFEEKTSSIC